MKRIFHILTLILLTSFVLSSCVQISPGADVVSSQPTDASELIETPILPTSTPAVTATAEPNSDLPAVMVIHDVAGIRLGPGLEYPLSHTLSSGTVAPILGRNETGDWWAVPGPGDGSGPARWVAGIEVTVQGEVSSVPFLPVPPLTTDIPAMGNTNPPAADTCTIAHPGQMDPLFVYEGPNEHTFNVVAKLEVNHWATVSGRENDWYQIQDATGMTGWVRVAQVAHNGLCQPDDGPGSLPLVDDPGSPPENSCVATRPEQFPPVDIRLGPGEHFGLTARLGNWAEILKTENGWHMILIGPDRVGWVNGEEVDQIGPCAASIP